MQVFVTENKHTDTVSTWSWGIADLSGNPILISARAYNTKEDADKTIQDNFKDWGLEVQGEL